MADHSKPDCPVSFIFADARDESFKTISLGTKVRVVLVGKVSSLTKIEDRIEIRLADEQVTVRPEKKEDEGAKVLREYHEGEEDE